MVVLLRRRLCHRPRRRGACLLAWAVRPRARCCCLPGPPTLLLPVVRIVLLLLLVQLPVLLLRLLLRLQVVLVLCTPRSEELRWKPLDVARPVRVPGEGFGDTDTVKVMRAGRRTTLPKVALVAAWAIESASRMAPGAAAPR